MTNLNSILEYKIFYLFFYTISSKHSLKIHVEFYVFLSDNLRLKLAVKSNTFFYIENTHMLIKRNFKATDFGILSWIIRVGEGDQHN